LRCASRFGSLPAKAFAANASLSPLASRELPGIRRRTAHRCFSTSFQLTVTTKSGLRFSPAPNQSKGGQCPFIAVIRW
jgi:hypothetical protein